jgi:dipeptidyl aminopeptidase/acylaminoacyl peptidase
MKLARTLLVALPMVLSLLPERASGQRMVLKDEKYVLPPKEIADAVTAPRHLNVTLTNLGPDGAHFLVAHSAGLPGLKEYAKPYVNLGEQEFDVTANRARQLSTRKDTGFVLWNWKTGRKTEIAAPPGRWVSSPSWSPDGTRIAYLVHSDTETSVYVAEIKDGKSRKLVAAPVLATLVTTLEWSPDSQSILTVLVPQARKPMPARDAESAEPEVRVTNTGPSPNRTFRFLMHTPHDMAMFEWLTTGQMALLDCRTGAARNVGEPAMVRSLDLSVDGAYIRATSILKPFSYTVPVTSFGTLEAIYDLSGKKLAEVHRQPLRESTVTRGAGPPAQTRFRGGRGGAGGGFGAGAGGGRGDNDRRSVTWRPDGRGLGFLQMEPRQRQQQDDAAGDRTPEPGRKDRVLQWLPPFDAGSLKVVFESETRIGNLLYSEDGETLFVSETKDGEEHLFAVRASDPKTRHTIYKHKTVDSATDPGTLMTRRSSHRGTVVRLAPDQQSVFLSGTRYSKNPAAQSPRPFVARVNFVTGERKDIFQSEENAFESVHGAGDDDIRVLFTTRETAATIPDSYARDLTTGELRKLTSNVDYSPEVTHAVRKRFQVERVDGIKFWVEVTLPQDYAPGTRLPAMFWFYPREYTDQKAYDQSAARYNRNAFPRVGTRSMSILTRRGYAVVEPDCPIIGPQGQMNNNYVPDLRNNLWAVIDALDKMGIIDRDRLGIGGHSYGAFSTANAMIHTPFFKAGIAGDGNYNRTLTPITFQSERRLLWEARETYLEMSPLLYANQMNGALLMYHGQDDSNNGTDPINSDRLFHALNALGKTAALYSYPYEDHGPAMKETLLDLWARWDSWLERYVKNPQKEAQPKPAEPSTEPQQNGR